MSTVNRKLVKGLSGLVLVIVLVFVGSYVSNTHAKEISQIQQEAESKEERIKDLTKDMVSKEKQVVAVETALEQKEKEKVALVSQVEKLKAEKLALAQTAKKAQEKLKSVQVASSASTKSPTSISRGNASVSKSIVVSATAYTSKCKGCSGITKTGVDIRNTTPKIIAVDPKVIPLGTKVEIIANGESMGYYSAQDTGGAIKGHKIDILMARHSSAIDFGRQKVVVRVLGK